MRIALLGYGKLGQIIEKLAIEQGHTIDLIIDLENRDELTSENLKKVDVAIEFSTPESAFNNIRECFKAGTPVVCGTTGWLAQWNEAVELCNALNGTLFYASNYSIGVNILFEINRRLANIMEQYPQYSATLKETHHIHKADAPSGTAISLANDIIAHHKGYSNWNLQESLEGEVSSQSKTDPVSLSVLANREAEIFGFHEVVYDSPIDTLKLSHNAKSREGFAQGALTAAAFVQNKKGVFNMVDLMGFKE